MRSCYRCWCAGRWRDTSSPGRCLILIALIVCHGQLVHLRITSGKLGQHLLVICLGLRKLSSIDFIHLLVESRYLRLVSDMCAFSGSSVLKAGSLTRLFGCRSCFALGVNGPGRFWPDSNWSWWTGINAVAVAEAGAGWRIGLLSLLLLLQLLLSWRKLRLRSGLLLLRERSHRRKRRDWIELRCRHRLKGWSEFHGRRTRWASRSKLI